MLSVEWERGEQKMSGHGEYLPGLDQLGTQQLPDETGVSSTKMRFGTNGGAGPRPTRIALWGELAAALGRSTDRLQDKLPSTPTAETIPAGTTYLIQLLAHDIVRSVRSKPGDQLSLSNAMEKPITLQCIYGLGPEVAPYLFAPKSDGLSIKFALGQLEGEVYPAASDLNRDRHAKLLPQKSALIADRRNDSNSFISQLTVLWAKFHNHVADEIQSGFHPFFEEEERDPQLSAAQRFRMVRYVTQRSWLNVIENDIMAKILDDDPAPYRGSLDGDQVNVELSHAVMRAFHALPLSNYKLQKTGLPVSLKVATGTGLAIPHRLKYPEWAIDRSQFFDCGQTLAQNRTKFTLGGNSSLTSKLGGETVPVGALDYLREEEMGVATVAKLEKLYGNYFLPQLTSGLRKGTVDILLQRHGVDPAVADTVAQAPPVSLFLQIESHLKNDGHRLGPVGSALFAGPVRQLMGFAGRALRADAFEGADNLCADTMCEILNRIGWQPVQKENS